MRIIPLTRNKYAIVDNIHYRSLNRHNWYCSDKGYACREVKGNTIYMHRLINRTPKGLFTDHINRNRLDNRKVNLRTVTNHQNQFNRSISKNNNSGYTGVYWESNNKKWKAQISINNKKLSLGWYSDIHNAHKAYILAKNLYHTGKELSLET